MSRRAFVIAVAMVFAGAAAAEPVDISLQVDGKAYRYSGQASCKQAEQASIYGIPAAQYSVAQQAGKESLHMTLWRPKDGAPAMLVLNVSAGGKRHEVDTVKSRTKRDTKGSGSAGFEKSGAGGSFRIDAVAADGAKLSGTIRCAVLGGLHAEGG
jgi:hypothetical protein